ncbi:MAG TPA: hypothetical protein PKK48_08985 [Phycisphaerae bacterium]|nr:hypothetical protein [Phycisphaerae bacterium]
MSIRFNLHGLDKLCKGLNDSVPLKDMFKQWGSRYLGFSKRRFKEYSRGGGDWPPLKRSTKLARTNAKRKKPAHGRRKRRTPEQIAAALSRKFSILNDTSTLLNALTIGFPGNLFEYISDGIRVGFGGPARHLDAKHPVKGVPPTIRDLAIFHDQGKGRLPQRQILVEPDDSTIRGMQSDVNRCIDRIVGH